MARIISLAALVLMCAVSVYGACQEPKSCPDCETKNFNEIRNKICRRNYALILEPSNSQGAVCASHKLYKPVKGLFNTQSMMVNFGSKCSCKGYNGKTKFIVTYDDENVVSDNMLVMDDRVEVYPIADNQLDDLNCPNYKVPMSDAGYNEYGYKTPYQNKYPVYQAQSYPAPAYKPSYPDYKAPVYNQPAYKPSYPSYSQPEYKAPAYPTTYKAPDYKPTYPTYHQPDYKGHDYKAPSYPSYSAPAYKAPEYHAPAYPSYPDYKAPSYPSYSQPAYKAPSYPAYQPPAYKAPDYHAPAYPTYSQPAYKAPDYKAPAYPTYPAPAYKAPAYPTYPAPAYKAPSYPTYSAPAYPTYSAPAYPTYSAPAYKAPSYPSYSAPAYNAYNPPAYHAPAYSPPSYPAPYDPYQPKGYNPTYSSYPTSYPASHPTYPQPAYNPPKYGGAPNKPYEAPASYPKYDGYQKDGYRNYTYSPKQKYSRRSTYLTKDYYNGHVGQVQGQYGQYGPKLGYPYRPYQKYDDLATQDEYARYFNYYFRKPAGYLDVGYFQAVPQRYQRNYYVDPRYFLAKYRKGYQGYRYEHPQLVRLPYYEPVKGYGPVKAYGQAKGYTPQYQKGYDQPKYPTLYASSSNMIQTQLVQPHEIRSKINLNQCPQMQGSCPVCLNHLDSNLASQLCQYKSIFSVDLEQKPVRTNRNSFCGKAVLNTPIYNSTYLPDEFMFSMPTNCQCQWAHEGFGSKLIVISPSNSLSNRYPLNDQTAIMDYSILNSFDVTKMIQKCQLN